MKILSDFDALLIHNKDPLKIAPVIRGIASRYLIARNPLDISDLRFETTYSNSYALVSERNSDRFKRIMNRLNAYIGSGPIGPSKYWEYPWVLANLRLQKELSVLDAGCGKSPIQFLLSDLGCRVFGIDPCENVKWHGIDRGLARRFGCAIEYRQEGMESISYPDETFDRVCCVSVIEHCRVRVVEDEKMTGLSFEDLKLHKRMMSEMIRVLRPGGFLVITVDFNFPRDNHLLDSNVDVKNLISVENVEVYGKRCPEPFPFEKGFDYLRLIQNSDIFITNYFDNLVTSIGFVLRKRD